MNKVIQFCYRKIIDSNGSKAWERLVFEDSYTEFNMQAQRFTKENRLHSFTEILQQNPSAEQLHFLVSAAVVPYVNHLQGKVPDILNTLGKQFLPFRNFRFEMIHSDTRDISKHVVAINFFSEPVTWLDSIGDKMILSLENEATNGIWMTETISLQPFLSICSIKQ